MTTEQPSPLLRVIKETVLIQFNSATEAFKKVPGGANWIALEDAMYALQGLCKLDGLQIARLYEFTAVGKVCWQIREWTMPRGDEAK